MLDVHAIKKDFPILSREINHKKLVYLDNAATSQKPQSVIDAISNYYSYCNANVHRGVHTLSDESTNLFETSKTTIANFLGAKNDEVIFVRNTTEAINGLAYGWGEQNIVADDLILVSILDHHSNIVVWQELCKRKKANLVFIKITKDGKFDFNDFDEKLQKFGHKLKLVAVPHVSNALGSKLDLKKLVQKVQKFTPKSRILVDGAQSAPHLPINFEKMNVDFFVFSGHKMLGPMGIGGLLVRENILKTGEMRPWLFGGGMIAQVHESHTNFQDDLSERFTPGTPDVASIVGLAEASRYLSQLGMENVHKHDSQLVAYALKKLAKIKNIEIVGPKDETRVGSVAFLYQGVHAHDVAQVLDSQGIAVRSGHHCTMPLHTSQNWVATTRASFQIYNSKDDVDLLARGLEKVAEILL